METNTVEEIGVSCEHCVDCKGEFGFLEMPLTILAIAVFMFALGKAY
jgi:hypothetical protein